jgi:hypothetical protein
VFNNQRSARKNDDKYICSLKQFGFIRFHNRGRDLLFVIRIKSKES